MKASRSKGQHVRSLSAGWWREWCGRTDQLGGPGRVRATLFALLGAVALFATVWVYAADPTLKVPDGSAAQGPELAREDTFNSNTFTDQREGFPARWRYRTIYTSAAGQPPTAITLTVIDPDATALPPVPMTPVAGMGTLSDGDFTNGELYEAVVLLLKNGYHSYRVDASDGTNVATLQGVGPTIRYLDHPTLAPVTGTSRDTYVLTVQYSNHPDPALYAAPSSITLFLDTNPVPVTARPVTESGSGAVRTYTATIAPPGILGQSLAPGQYRHYWAATVGGRPERLPASGVLSGPSVPTATPVLSQASPATLRGGVPLDMGPSGNWTFRVVYTEANNVAPTSITVQPRDPQGGNIGTAQAMTPTADLSVPATLRDGAVFNGEVYEATCAIPAVHGLLSYVVNATNGVQSATPLTGQGPTINNVPTLSGLKMTSATDDAGTPLIEAVRNEGLFFEVIYRDADRDPPSGPVQLRIYDPNGQALPPVPMSTTDTNVNLLPTTGWRYTATNVNLENMGVRVVGTFSYEAVATDGYPATAPQSVVSPANADLRRLAAFKPELSGVRVTPGSGAVGLQAFTFEAVFKDGDDTPPAPGYPRLTIQDSGGSDVTFNDPGGPVNSVVMTAADSAPFSSGRLYRYTSATNIFSNLGAGTYSFRVQASDGTYTVTQTVANQPVVYDPGTISLGVPSGAQGPELARENTFNSNTFTAASVGFPARWRYRVIYTSQGNQAPAFINLTVTDPDGNAMPAIAMTRTPGMGTLSDSNYINGELFEAVALLTLNGDYTYRVDASDGNTTASLVRNGPSVRYLGNPTLTPSEGTSVDTYTVSVDYSNHPDPAQFVLPTSIDLYLDTNDPPTTRRTLTPAATGNPRRFTAQLAPPDPTGQSLPPGQYRYFFQVATGGRTERQPAAGSLSGPSIPVADPVLTLLAPALLQGGTATNVGSEGSWTFRVVYTERNNIAPTSIRLTPRDQYGQAIPGAARDMVPTTDSSVAPILRDGSYANGEMYEATTTIDLTPDYHGTLSYLVEASNGTRTASLTGFGPTIGAVPVLSNLRVLSPNDDPNTPGVAEAARNDEVLFEVIYQDADGDVPPANGVQIRIYRPDDTLAATIPMATQETNTALIRTTGWKYQALVNLQPVTTSGIGVYSYEAAATDNFPTNAPEWQVSARNRDLRVELGNRPELSGARVTPTTGVIGTQTFTFEVFYKDADGNAPAGNAPVLTIQNGSGADVTFKDGANGLVTSVRMPQANPADNTPFTTGRWYRYTTSADAFNRLTAGKYSFKVEATDGRYRTFASLTDAFELTGSPIADPPRLTVSPPSPAEGPNGTAFTWTLTYVDLANLGPDATYPRLYLRDPSGNAVPDPENNNAPYFVMSPMPGGTFITGRQYSLTRVLTTPGQYSFYVEARNTGNGYARVPTAGWMPGPLLYTPPQITTRAVTPASGRSGTTFEWQVTYVDADNHAPQAGYPRVIVTDPQGNVLQDPANLNAPYFVMTEVDPADTTYNDGKTYRASLTLTASGTYAYYVEAVCSGGETARAPATGKDATPRVFTPPSVSIVTDALAASGLPEGPLGTAFTWTISYTDADQHLPAATYPRLVITGPDGRVVTNPAAGNVPYFTMAPVGGAGYQDGKQYTYTSGAELAQSGTYQYHIEVLDAGGDWARAPSAGEVKRPLIYGLPTLTRASVNPTAASEGATFIWSVTYSHENNLAPDAANDYPRLIITDPNNNILRDPNNSKNPYAPYFVMQKLNPSAMSYKDGVDYVFSRKLVQPGVYRFRIEVQDSAGVRVLLPSAGNLDGPTVYANPTLNQAQVTPSGGPKGTSFTWSVEYADRDNHAPKAGYPRLVIIGPSGAPLTDPANNNAPYFVMQAEDPNDLDFVSANRYTFTRALTTVGAYRFYVEVVDQGEGSARTPAAGEVDGPNIFTGPSFRDASLTPAKGTPVTRFAWTVTYVSPDNLPPAINYPRLVITDPSGNPVPDPTNSNVPFHVARKVDPSDAIFTDGVAYIVERSLPVAGTYKYRWEVTDTGTSSARWPATGDTTGPVVESVVNPRVTPTAGGPGDYTFMVDYFGPSGVQLGDVKATLRITTPGGAAMAPVDMVLTSGTDPAAGLTFSAVVRLDTIGDYSFQVEVNDGRATYTTAKVTQPRVAGPLLSGASVSPAKGIVGQVFSFTARYRHGNRVAATQVKVNIVKPDGSTITAPMATKDKDTALLESAGWLYQADVPLVEAGNYSFTVEASDGLSTVTSASVSGPEVSGPQLSNPSVSPATGGYTGGVFTFSVVYTYGANQAPKLVRLLLTNPDGTKAPPIEMVPQPEGQPFNVGRLYTKNVTLFQAGTYRFACESSEDGVTITAATPEVQGPVVDEAAAPTLTDLSVAPIPGQPSLFTYSVVYQQAQGVAPVWVRLLIDVDGQGQAQRTVDMLPEDPTSTAYATGVRYLYNLSQPLSPGPHNFKVQAHTGFVLVESPLQQGPSINRPPTLQPQKVSPESGDENTLFTFSAIYADPDNDAPEYVRVNVGNRVVALSKADATQNDYRAGVLYQAQTQLPAGNLAHAFHAADVRQAVVRAPEAGLIDGPIVKPATQVNVVASPTEATLDGVSRVAVSGSLSPAVANASVRVTAAFLTTQADGTPTEEVRTALDVTTDDQGKFSAGFVPDQAGPWRLRVQYAGDATRGSGVGTADVMVLPASRSFVGGLHLMSLPAAPPGNDLRNVLSGAPFEAWVFRSASEGYVAGTVLPPGGPGSVPLTPPPGKGLGFWVRGAGALTAKVEGRLNDHSQPLAIDLHEGWNLIGSPFLSATNWADARYQLDGRLMTLAEARAAGLARAHAWTWDAARNEYRLLDATLPGADRSLGPWQGAWFYNKGAGKLVLAAPGTRAQEPAESRSDRTPRSDQEWTLRLVASNGVQWDSFNYVGVTSEGRAAATAALESPPPAQYSVDLYFVGPNGEGRYATDFRSPSAGALSWDVVVETDVQDRPITVSTPDISQLPKNLVVYLEDLDAGGKRTYLRTAGGYTFNPGAAGRRRLRLVVQPKDAGQLLVTDVTLQAARGGRVIGYTLSRDAVVTVEILSPSGKRIALVADRQASPAGRASVVWDGRRADGASLPAGIYLIQVTARTEEEQSTRALKAIVLTR